MPKIVKRPISQSNAKMNNSKRRKKKEQNSVLEQIDLTRKKNHFFAIDLNF